MIILKLIEGYGFHVFIDDEFAGNICPGSDANEWVAHTVEPNGAPSERTSNDILDSIDDVEAAYYKNQR